MADCEVNMEINDIENKKENTMKTKIETAKTIVITVLVTAIIAFAGGMQYQRMQHDQMKSEAAAIVKNVKIDVSKQ